MVSIATVVWCGQLDISKHFHWELQVPQVLKITFIGIKIHKNCNCYDCFLLLESRSKRKVIVTLFHLSDFTNYNINSHEELGYLGVS